ncbi:MAG: DNA primase, partial [Patescibacteria group bacterium]
NLCGKGAANKHIPFVLQTLSPVSQMVLVKAIHKGDGHNFVARRSLKHHKSTTTISCVLAHQLVDILLRNNLFPSLSVLKERDDRLGVHHRESYHVFWSEEATSQHTYVYTDADERSFWLLPVKEIKREMYAGPVHNLTVEKDHSYIAANFAVANCGKGGDVFSFLQEMEGLEFVEALKVLAARAGVPLEPYRNDIAGSQKNRIKEINTEAARFFHRFLLEIPSAKNAREYLSTRGLKQETIDEWQVGYIPDQWDLLTQYLLKKGHGIDDLIASGLTIKRDGADVKSGRGFYDRFRGRIMFPIWDIHGTVVGFTGRVLVETERSGGKYVNTPQTSVYDKSRVIFGLNKAKQEIRKKNLIVMVEGQMDVIACHEAGMKNVVAASGTALTDEQAKLMSRYSDNVSVAFDADAAGIAASQRGIGVLLSHGMHVKIIIIPEGMGKDPDECARKNFSVWTEAVRGAKDVIAWHMEKAFSGRDIADPRQKQMVANEVLSQVVRIPFAVEREHWLQELSGRLRVDAAVLREDMIRLRESQKSKVFSQKSIVKDADRPIEKKLDRLALLGERLLALLLRFPELISISNLQSPISNQTPLYTSLKAMYTTNHSIDLDALRKVHEHSNGENIIDVLLLYGEKEFFALQNKEAEKELEWLTAQISDEWGKKRRKE